MHDFLAQQLIDFIRNLTLQAKKTNRFVQGKIPSQTLPLRVIDSVLTTLKTKCDFQNDVDWQAVRLEIKISKKAYEDWVHDESSKGLALSMQSKHPEWFSDTENLTTYRNEIANQLNDKETILLLLVGCDKVADQASLDHLWNFGPEEIWEDRLGMGGSFTSWIQEICDNCHLDYLDASETIADIDNLLITIKDFSDLEEVSQYLETETFEGVDSLSNLFSYLADHLDDMRLASFRSLSPKKKDWRKTFSAGIKLCEDIFEGHYSMNDAQLKNVLKNIDKLVEKYQEDPDDRKVSFLNNRETVFPTYDSAEAYLSDCKTIVSGTFNAEILKKFRQCDFNTFMSKVLKYHEPKKKTKISETLVTGNPLEMLLSSIWISLQAWINSDEGDESNHMLSSIVINPCSFNHAHSAKEAFDSDETTKVNDLNRYVFEDDVEPSLGGLDEYFEAVVPSLFECLGTEFTCTSKLCDFDAYQGNFDARPTAIPALHFCVVVNNSDDCTYKFRWQVPNNNGFKINADLVKLIWEKDNGLHPILPMVMLKDYAQAYGSASDDRVLELIGKEMKDDNGIIVKDLLQYYQDGVPENISQLSYDYHDLLEVFQRKGLYGMLAQPEKCEKVVCQYASCLKYYTKNTPWGGDDPEANPLLHAFWIEKKQEFCELQDIPDYVDTEMLMYFHPAMIEMLQSQAVYLCDSFEYALSQEVEKEKNTNKRNLFATSIWNNYLDLACLQSPVPVILKGKDKSVNTTVLGDGAVFRLGGAIGDDQNSLMSTLVTQSDFDEDDISDNVLLQGSKESVTIYDRLIDYYKVHEQARDGLSLAVFKTGQIQPVIAAIQAYLETLAGKKEIDDENLQADFPISKNRENNPFVARITFYTDLDEHASVSLYISRWHEYWNARCEAVSNLQNCKLILSNRLVNYDKFNNSKNRKKDIKDFLGDRFDDDIVIFYGNAAKSEKTTCFKQTPPLDNTKTNIKFPILEKQKLVGATDLKSRSRIFSNRQFVCYREILRFLGSRKNSSLPDNIDNYVIEKTDYSVWLDLLSVCHAQAERVICIGKTIDKSLIKDNIEGAEFIGFSTGVGNHADENVTVSTINYHHDMFTKDLGYSFQQVFPDVCKEPSEREQVVKNLWPQSNKMAGMSLVRAIGAYDTYKRDFFAYSMTRKLLKRTDVNCVGDVVVSLDSYRHWFSNAPKMERPDLLWLYTTIEGEGVTNSTLHIHATIIECKSAQDFLIHKDKAVEQVLCGVTHLEKMFKPRSSEGFIDNPTERYNWMQLYRLLIVEKQKENERLLYTLEKVAEGDYTISWDCCVLGYCTKLRPDHQDVFSMNLSSCLPKPFPCDSLYAYLLPEEAIKKVCLTSDDSFDSWDVFREKAQSAVAPVENLDIEEEKPVDEKPTEDDEDDDDEFAVSDSFDDEVTLEEEGETDVPITPPEESIPEETVLPEENPPVPSDTQTKEPEEKESPPLTVVNPSEGIFLGLDKYGAPHHWDFFNPKLPNRHLLVLGSSGSGKSYSIECLLSELARKSVPSLILDYSGSFTAAHLEKPAEQFTGDQIYLNDNKKVDLNPLERLAVESEKGQFHEESIDCMVDRVSGIFDSMFTLGSNQMSLLKDALKKAVSENNAFELKDLEKVVEGLASSGSILYDKASFKGIHAKIGSFTNNDYFTANADNKGWETLFSIKDAPRLIKIIQMNGLADNDMYTITSFMLWGLFNYLVTIGNTKDNPRVVVLDECQNLQLSSKSCPVMKYMSEGRKYGISLITATQTITRLGGAKDPSVSNLMQAGTKLFFKPASTETKIFADLLRMSDARKTTEEWSKELSSLELGECILLTDTLKGKGVKIKIASFKDRGMQG